MLFTNKKLLFPFIKNTYTKICTNGVYEMAYDFTIKLCNTYLFVAEYCKIYLC